MDAFDMNKNASSIMPWQNWTSSQNWTSAEYGPFLDAVKRRPLLYVPTEPLHMNRAATIRAYHEIKEELPFGQAEGITVKYLKQKFKNAKAAIRTFMKPPTGSAPRTPPDWYAHGEFLASYVNRRKGKESNWSQVSHDDVGGREETPPQSDVVGGAVLSCRTTQGSADLAGSPAFDTWRETRSTLSTSGGTAPSLFSSSSGTVPRVASTPVRKHQKRKLESVVNVPAPELVDIVAQELRNPYMQVIEYALDNLPEPKRTEMVGRILVGISQAAMVAPGGSHSQGGMFTLTEPAGSQTRPSRTSNAPRAQTTDAPVHSASEGSMLTLTQPPPRTSLQTQARNEPRAESTKAPVDSSSEGGTFRRTAAPREPGSQTRASLTVSEPRAEKNADERGNYVESSTPQQPTVQRSKLMAVNTSPRIRGAAPRNAPSIPLRIIPATSHSEQGPRSSAWLHRTTHVAPIRSVAPLTQTRRSPLITEVDLTAPLEVMSPYGAMTVDCSAREEFDIEKWQGDSTSSSSSADSDDDNIVACEEEIETVYE